jgi:CelD/BcsL family acetyltransferase involved in cellulose biosynthesis
MVHADPEPLRSAWAELHTPEATPFMHPGWAFPWWRHYGAGRRAFVVEAEGGIGAFAISRRGGQRILETWGTPRTDHWDVLAPAGRRDAVMAAVAEALVGERRRWDAAFLRCLPPDGAFERALERAGAAIGVSRPEANPVIALPDDFEAYLQTLSKKMRQDVRRPLKLLDEGTLEIRAVTDPAELPGALERWQEIRRVQWEAADRQINPEHLDTRFRDFLLDASRELVPAGLALVWEVLHEGKVVGVKVSFADEHCFYSYLGGFDPAVTKLGVGRLFVAESIRSSIAAGRRTFDFGRGDEAYKYRYGATDRHLGTIVAGSRRPRSRLVVAGARAMTGRRG